MFDATRRNRTYPGHALGWLSREVMNDAGIDRYSNWLHRGNYNVVGATRIRKNLVHEWRL
jgi:hypothetical protein